MRRFIVERGEMKTKRGFVLHCLRFAVPLFHVHEGTLRLNNENKTRFCFALSSICSTFVLEIER